VSGRKEPAGADEDAPAGKQKGGKRNVDGGNGSGGDWRLFMAWKTITAEDVLSEFTPQEQATLKGIQGATEQLPGIVGRVINAARGAIRAGGYALGDEGTAPEQFESDVVAIARWRWLIAFPQLQRLQTPERQAAHDLGQRRLDQVALQRLGAEPPVAGAYPASGSWNSESKVIGRMQRRESEFAGGDAREDRPGEQGRLPRHDFPPPSAEEER